MFHVRGMKVLILQFLAVLSLCSVQTDSLIITSVIAGDKKFKTISFDSKLLKPLTFEKDMPLTEFRRHRTLRPPKFDIDVNIPIKLPLEEEYPQEEYKKPVETNLFFQSGEINEPTYGKDTKTYNYNLKKSTYQDEVPYSAASSNQKQLDTVAQRDLENSKPIHNQETFETLPLSEVPAENQSQEYGKNARSDPKDSSLEQQEQAMLTQDASEIDYSRKGYAGAYQSNDGHYKQDFVPGGYVNLQLSGPTGGPKPTYEDYDREKWAQQLSQAPGAMPYPILNYHQLQNFYGGLGTFTNGLAENRYEPISLLDKLKSGLSHFTNKFHFSPH